MEKEELKYMGDGIFGTPGEKMMDFYNSVAERYDAYNETVGIPDQEVMLKILLEKEDIPRDIPICDFGCGTGQTGRDFTKAGFTNLTGIDGSEKMLDIARKEGLYKKLLQGMLGVGKLPEELKGKFKIAVSTGLFSWGHGPFSTFDEMISSLTGEKGDKLIFSIRDDQYFEVGYKEYLDKLAADSGLIELVREEKYARYTNMKKEDLEEASFIKPRNGVIVWYEHTGKKA